MSKHVKDVMTTGVVTVTPSTSLKQIAAVLNEHAFSAVPVVDDTGKIVGMITEKDLLQPYGTTRQEKREKILARFAEGLDLADEIKELVSRGNFQAAKLMSSPVVTTDEDASLADVADIMIKHDIKRLPVVKDGKLTGIVARADLIKAISSLSNDTDF